VAYACTIYDSIDQVPPSQWDAVRDANDLATDPRLLRAQQITLADQCRCWIAVVTDDATGHAVAGACMCLFRVDAVDTTGKMIQAAANGLRRVWPAALRFRVLFCGLPVPSGESHLRIRPGAGALDVLRTLESSLRDIAKREGALMIVYKEFDDEAMAKVQSLEEVGYTRGEIPQAYVLRQMFPSFEDLCKNLRADYRRQIKHSLKKFAKAPLRIEHLYGDDIAAAYTDDVHRLYESVWSRAKFRLEKFPAEFFREVSRQFGAQASMTVAKEHDGRIVGFVFGLTDGNNEFHNLYGGVGDDQLSDDVDLFFNLQYQDLDRALRSGVRAIHMGQTADAFKVRLGAAPKALFCLARAVNPVLNWGFHKAKPLVFPPVPNVPARNAFKSESAGDTAPAPSAGSRAGKGDT
jgi:hypothetical protein